MNRYGDEKNKYVTSFKRILCFKHGKPPKRRCFDHTCGHPQGGVYKRCVTKALKPNNMNTAHMTRIVLTTVSPTCCHIYYFIY